MSERDEREPRGRVVVEIGSRGKLVVGEPFFEPGVPVVIDRKGLRDAQPGRPRCRPHGTRPGAGRARRRAGGPRSRTCSRALLLERGEEGAHEPHELPEPSLDGRVDLRELPAFTIDPETAKDFDDAISVRRDGDGLRAYVHIADVSFFVPAGTPLDRGAAERGFSVYVPGLVAPMLPHDLADDACSLRPHQDRLTVTVEVPFDASLQAGEPLFYRSVIRSRARLTYGQARADPRRRGAGADPDVERGAAARRAARDRAPPAPVRARRASHRDARDHVRVRRPRRRRAGLVRERAARAHARRGADDPRQRGRRRAARRSAPRRALPRPRAARSAVDPAAARHARRPRGADAARARSGAADGRRRGAARGRDRRSRQRLRRAVGTRRRGLPVARPPLAEAGPLRPAQPRPLRAREHRLLPLHLADPPLSRPRRPPRAPARARRRRRAAAARPVRARRARVRARAGRRRRRVRRRRHLPRLAARRDAVRARLGDAVRGRDHRADRLRPVRPLRRRLRGLPPRAPARRRLLRARTCSAPRSKGGGAGGATGSATRSRSGSSRSIGPRARSRSGPLAAERTSRASIPSRIGPLRPITSLDRGTIDRSSENG